ncbi:MAG: 30S ribosomal protein S8 [Candidatus Eisenbacteria bacterium]|uniref:Small ribosomal subunit protein uS8 n=1 Tax=Eiseniibacteriota bacterium TaxID=2212470 RepID=A0A9D6L974_UNCEI|nr:30S ribosomal protein S8 [Candidatus Eisenbacteria bacterium]MBI3538938.1 30S ribosomal protein S8 [Candidatus Eisenbacteria bacterium]
MAVSDPVADFLTCVRNAIRAKHRKVDVNASKLKTDLARVLLRERFINNFKVIEDQKQGVLRIYLKYTGDDASVITGIRRMSTPGRRVYVKKDRLPRVMGGLGTSIISTSRGLMTDREAREAGLGGELVAQVW